MALEFPSTPNDGDRSLQSNGVTYIWDAANTRWKAAAPSGISEFDLKLGGYANSGLSETYTGDLNAIIVNSKFDILGSDVTNEPADFNALRRGWVMTMMNPVVTTFATQVIYGNNIENANKIWMRSKDNGVWGAWVLVVDGAAAPPVTMLYGQTDSAGTSISKTNGGTTVAKNGTGDYTITINPALPDAEYAVQLTNYAFTGQVRVKSGTYQPSRFSFTTADSAGIAADSAVTFLITRQLP